MKKAALILCILGFSALVVGSALAIPSVRNNLSTHFGLTISSSGTIGCPDESSSQTIGVQTNLDIVGYLTILSSIGFFAAGLVISRKKN